MDGCQRTMPRVDAEKTGQEWMPRRHAKKACQGWLPRRLETWSSRFLQHVSTEISGRSKISTIQVNPGLLVVVEGVEYAGNLEGARHHPIVLNRQIYLFKKLVKLRDAIGTVMSKTDEILSLV